MNIRLALMDMIKRFAIRRESPRPVEKRRCVFILVPLDFHGNGHAKKAEVGQNSILIDDPELNYDLMWTWFLPNPLWLPKRRE